MLARLNLVIVLPYQVRTSLNAKTNWNNLSIPIMNHKADTAVTGVGQAVRPRTSRRYLGRWFTGFWGLPTGTPSFVMVLNGNVGDELLPHQRLPGRVWRHQRRSVVRSHDRVMGINSDSLKLQPHAARPGQRYGIWSWSKPVRALGQDQHVQRWRVRLRPAACSWVWPASLDRQLRSRRSATFFGPTGAVELGGKQVLRNGLRWLMNPDSFPFPLKVKSTSPA